MSTAVIDASLLYAMLKSMNVTERVRPALGDAELAAPDLVNLEVLSALRREAAAGVIDEDSCADVIADLLAFPVDRYPTAPLVPRAWDLRPNLTVYDAAYVALAEDLDCPVVTRDGRLSRAPGLPVPVIDLAAVGDPGGTGFGASSGAP